MEDKILPLTLREYLIAHKYETECKDLFEEYGDYLHLNKQNHRYGFPGSLMAWYKIQVDKFKDMSREE